MDTHFYTRTSIAGWLFAAVVLASLWYGNRASWHRLVDQFRGEDAVGVWIAGAVVGIGAPPAFGFVLERLLAAVVWWRCYNVWRYPGADAFKARLAAELANGNAGRLSRFSGGAIFHAFFYSCADEKMLDWARRRRTQMYGSFTSALALGLAILLSWVALDARSLRVLVVSVTIAVAMWWHGWHEHQIQEEAIAAWSETIGVRVAQEFANSLRQQDESRTTEAPILAPATGDADWHPQDGSAPDA